MIVTEDGAVVGSVDRAALAELQGDDEAEDLSSLTKAELVERAEAAGVVGISGMNKADLVAALEGVEALEPEPEHEPED